MSIQKQIGQFFLFLGIVGLIVFFITDQADSPNYLYFCSGGTITFLGVYLMWLGRVPAKPADRFSILRKMREKRAKKR